MACTKKAPRNQGFLYVRYCTPKRLLLLKELHKIGCVSINTLYHLPH